MQRATTLTPNMVSLTPRKLAWVILAIGVFVSSLIAYPLGQVFAGNWKLHQQINIAFIEQINIGEYFIPIGQLSIRYYSIMILLGMLAGYTMAVYLSRWHYIAGTIVDRLFIGLVIFGLIGARTFYVIFNWSEYQVEPVNALMIFRGGLSFFGMLIGGFLYIWAYTSRFKFNIWEFLDFLAPSVLVGQVIGRFGNLFNYEGYGGPTSVFWKMFIPGTANIYDNINEQFFHPTFLYEIIPNFILLVYILYYYERLTSKRCGLVFAVYAIGYGIIRIITEMFRLDALKIVLPNAYRIAGLNIDAILVSQLAAFVLLLIGIYTWFYRRKIIYLKRTMAEVTV